ncbi:MAG: hypothetical protein L6437_03175 [Kiritimatiellae bacterium]|nr:hypothetical protein [Kiritimatiellia bacterium]
MAHEIFSLASLGIFSLADLRYRTVPAAEIFFLGSVLLASQSSPLAVGFIVLAVAWGIARWPGWIAWPLLLYPPAWIVLLAGFGVRQGLIGRGDLLVLGGLACLLPWTALIFVLLGVESWRRWLRWRGKSGMLPAIPGMFLGVAAYVLVKIILPGLP